MNASEAREWVEKVRALAANDNEAAHSEEDALREAVLRFVVEHGDPLSSHLAKIALSTGEIDYVRWYA